MDLSVGLERWPLRYPFRITGHTFTESEVVVVRLGDGESYGCGEASGVYYNGESAALCRDQIVRVSDRIRAGIGRVELLEMLPPGGARNAVDCALWDLEAKQRCRPAWELAGLTPPRPILTTQTIGAAEPERMAQRARASAGARALKLKLTGEEVDADRVRAVRSARPDVWLAVDANQGYTRATLEPLLPLLVEARVELLEQPFAVGRERDMDDLHSPIPTAADESAQDLGDLEGLAGRFDAVNIKLDKCGGLTRGLAMAAQARKLGMKVMVGCMTGTSLSIAPALLVGQLCDIVDLDGPLLLANDREPAVSYADGYVRAPEALWGAGTREAVET